LSSKLHILIIILLNLIISNVLVSQENTKIKIEKAGFFDKDNEKFPNATVLTRDNLGQVIMTHDGVKMWCNQAFFYEERNFIEAYGNVILIQGDTIDLKSSYLEYNGDSKLAYAKGNVVLNEPASTLYTESLFFDRKIQEAYYNNHGKLIKNPSDTIISDIGRFFIDLKKYRFKENINLKTPNQNIYSKKLDYFTESGLAYFYGPTDIISKDTNIYCEIGFFDTNNDSGYFIKNAEIDFNDSNIKADSIYFDNKINYAAATNNIKITDTINKTTSTGHYAEIFKETDSMYITKRALVASYQKNDSIYIHSDTILMTGNEKNRIIRAFKNAKIFKSDLSGKADSIHFNRKNGLAKLININGQLNSPFIKTKKPILWTQSNQITGDSIHLLFNIDNDNIDSLLVFNNALIINKDSIGPGYNQISGQKLYGNFIDNELRKIDIVKNAESIYYLRNSDNELVGIDRSKSGRIKILLDNNSIEKFKKINQIDGNTYPEEDFLEELRFLKGFYFREDEKPNSIKDLFIDDPQLILKKIKSLEIN
tara:strand:+ start:280 stop:1893 length:1614 start_codon:yes stop_codon:yes gene_type:complete